MIICFRRSVAVFDGSTLDLCHAMYTHLAHALKLALRNQFRPSLPAFVSQQAKSGSCIFPGEGSATTQSLQKLGLVGSCARLLVFYLEMGYCSLESRLVPLDERKGWAHSLVLNDVELILWFACIFGCKHFDVIICLWFMKLWEFLESQKTANTYS